MGPGYMSWRQRLQVAPLRWWKCPDEFDRARNEFDHLLSWLAHLAHSAILMLLPPRRPSRAEHHCRPSSRMPLSPTWLCSNAKKKVSSYFSIIAAQLAFVVLGCDSPQDLLLNFGQFIDQRSRVLGRKRVVCSSCLLLKLNIESGCCVGVLLRAHSVSGPLLLSSHLHEQEKFPRDGDLEGVDVNAGGEAEELFGWGQSFQVLMDRKLKDVDSD